MSPSQKMTFFKMLVQVGYKEIEVAYPAASDLDFNFVRKVIEDNEAGDDVFIQVRPAPASLLPLLARVCRRTVQTAAGLGLRNACLLTPNAHALAWCRFVARGPLLSALP